ncbi:MAG: hypothetical protein ACXAC7_09745 [Candidatus Hodarchaeales archaeon]
MNIKRLILIFVLVTSLLVMINIVFSSVTQSDSSTETNIITDWTTHFECRDAGCDFPDFIIGDSNNYLLTKMSSR